MTFTRGTNMAHNKTIEGKELILWDNRKADLLRYSEIHDPDKPTASGNIVPSVDSVVIKEDRTLWVVTNVDDRYKVTLSPVENKPETVEEEVNIITYTSDRYRLYIDIRTNPFRLVADTKLCFFGLGLKEYILFKVKNGEETSISAYIDSRGEYISDRIPMTTMEGNASFKIPTNCHTLERLKNDEVILMRVYNTNGIVSAEINLYVKEAAVLNDLNSTSNPIIEFNVDCLQEQSDDTFYIYAKQPVESLNFMPYLIFADGSRKDVPIDNMKSFLFGLEDFTSDYPGHSQELIFKYFPGKRETVYIPEANQLNHIVRTKKLTVVSKYIDYELKLSVIPVYDKISSTWNLRYFAYTTARDKVYDVTDHVKLNKGYEYDGTFEKWGIEQILEVTYDLTEVFQTDDAFVGIQRFRITVKNPAEYERYIISDAGSDVYYGVDGSITRRPIVYYDDKQQMYFIPTSIFKNKEAFVESFYTLSRPLYNTKEESGAPVPTHFTMRSASNGRMLVGGLIPITEYQQMFNTMMNVEKPAIKDTVIIEFVQVLDESTSLILYGVPVDIAGPYEFNNETN